ERMMRLIVATEQPTGQTTNWNNDPPNKHQSGQQPAGPPQDLRHEEIDPQATQGRGNIKMLSSHEVANRRERSFYRKPDVERKKGQYVGKNCNQCSARDRLSSRQGILRIDQLPANPEAGTCRARYWDD